MHDLDHRFINVAWEAGILYLCKYHQGILFPKEFGVFVF
jgi:hypothetical protein